MRFIFLQLRSKAKFEKILLVINYHAFVGMPPGLCGWRTNKTN
jgi:hypothetical protein